MTLQSASNRALEAHNLTFGYRSDQQWFQNISLQLEGGKIYGLLGRNGAGKTTLIKLLCGLLKPLQGVVSIAPLISGNSFQKDSASSENTSAPLSHVSVWPRNPVALANMVFVPETAELADVTPPKLGSFAGALYPRFSQTKYLENLNALEVPLGKRTSQLSFGQRRKTHIAFALATGARLLFLDEPTNGLDVSAQIALRKLLIANLTEDQVVVVSTHHVREFETVLDEVIVLDRGQILEVKSLEQIQASSDFSDLEHYYLRILENPAVNLQNTTLNSGENAR